MEAPSDLLEEAPSNPPEALVELLEASADLLEAPSDLLEVQSDVPLVEPT